MEFKGHHRVKDEGKCFDSEQSLFRQSKRLSLDCIA